MERFLTFACADTERTMGKVHLTATSKDRKASVESLQSSQTQQELELAEETLKDVEEGEEVDHWAQCDSCGKWRDIDHQQAAAVEAAGEGAQWVCSMLFQGAGCSMTDDWLLQQRRTVHQSARRARAAAAVAEQAAAAQAKADANKKREARRQERASGVAVDERYAKAQGYALNLIEATDQLLQEAGANLQQDVCAVKQRGCGAGGTKRKRPVAVTEEERESCEQWEECPACGHWTNLGRGAAAGAGGPCAQCGAHVTRQQHEELQSWVQCDDCGKWRSTPSDQLREAEGGVGRWVCGMMRAGATCRTSAGDWGSVVRRQAAQEQRAARTATPLHLSERLASGQGLAAASERWQARPLPASNAFLEYIPGRDTLYPADRLAAGLDAYDASSGEHLLWSTALPAEALADATPLVIRGLQLFQEHRLPQCIDGRSSAGPVDLAAFLAQAWVQEALKVALHKRRTRLAAGGVVPPKTAHMLHHVIHVHPDGRKVYIGEEGDVTKNGGSIMGFMKAWKSCPIQSWSGGQKMADMPGSMRLKLVSSKLSGMLAAEEAQFVAAAERVWDVFAAHPQTADAAQRMLQHLASHPQRAASCLGRSAWNAYSFNIDFRTGRHVDGKNTAGSYSALLVCETGRPFHGSLYMLPQYAVGLDVRQGVIVFHRSGDATVGTHGNTGLWTPGPDSHRIALVLYQTELKGLSKEPLAEPCSLATEEQPPQPAEVTSAS